jgi:hypothetical protein
MGKSQEGHGTVENDTRLLDCNRERDTTTLYKKCESKQQRGCITISRNFQHPKKPSEMSIQRTGCNWMVGTRFKGRVTMQWKVYTEQHLNAKGIKLKIQEWSPKLINAMWDHITRLWHYPNDAVHIKDSKQVAQF